MEENVSQISDIFPNSKTIDRFSKVKKTYLDKTRDNNTRNGITDNAASSGDDSDSGSGYLIIHCQNSHFSTRY